MKKKNLAIIPARGGSTRIPKKNIKLFNGLPLIAHTIRHAKQSKLFDRIVVDTDSPDIAKIAKKYGAEVPFLRPAELATNSSKVADAIEFLLNRLEQEHRYKPNIITLLQTTSPIREVDDIVNCYKVMIRQNVPSVCTVTETSPWFLHLSSENKIILVNKKASKSTNTQQVRKGYVFNGCFVYMIDTKRFLKTKKFVDEETVGVICPKWRSVDLDHPEDWVLAEVIHKNYKKIKSALKKFK